MRYRRLGSSDLEVSEIALGSWLTYGGGVGRDEAVACVERAFELGINFIDTANVYARGAAEELLGELLANRPRESYVLATKLYFPMSKTDRGLSREQVFKQLDASLERLRTSYVDLYQCHRYDGETPLEETMEALTEVVRQGKVRYLGFSEWNGEQIEAALDLHDRSDGRIEKFVSSQPQYSLLWRKPEREVFPLSAANGISQVVWSPLAQGRSDRQVRARQGAAAALAGNLEGDGRDDRPLAARRDPRGGAAPGADRGGARNHDGAARARLGVERAERRLGDRRGVPAGAGRRERRGL